MTKKKYPEGHFLSYGIALGLPLGLPFGLAMGGPEFFGSGMAIGMCLGLAFGYALEEKYKKEGRIRPLTAEEKEKKDKLSKITIAGLLVGAIILLAFVLFR